MGREEHRVPFGLEESGRVRPAWNESAIDSGQGPALGYAATVPITNEETMGWLRSLVGAALIVAPGAPMRLSRGEPPTGAALLLMRTIGIRDLVLGVGTVVAARSGQTGDVNRWNSAALASDSLDTVVSLASFRSIGKRDAWAAAALAFAFVCGDIRALRRVQTGPSAS
jgi:hypothetical protein